jgi:signal peptidase I
MLLVLSIDWLGTPFLLKHVGGIAHYRLSSSSMDPTCRVGDIVAVDTKSYRTRKPLRGDIIIFKSPLDPSKCPFKRVIALEGEKLEIKNKQVYVNGESLSEPYKVHRGTGVQDILDNFGPLLIPVGHCFVMGDNRDFSADSRSWGPLPLINIMGKLLYIDWSKDIKRIGPTPE